MLRCLVNYATLNFFNEKLDFKEFFIENQKNLVEN